jgi:phosphatidate cytidylyltransferase
VSGKGERDRVLITRIAFGSVLLLLVAGLVWLDLRSGKAWGTAALIGLALSLGVREVWAMLGAATPVPWRGGAVLLSLGLVALQLLRQEGVAVSGDADVLLLTCYLLVFFGAQLRHVPDKDRLVGIALHAFGVVYLLLTGLVILRLRFADALLPPELAERAAGFGLTALIYAVLAAKGGDMVAFFVGRAFGRRKLIPWISPGKTYAGAAGALLGAVLVTVAFQLWTPMGAVVPWSVAAPLAILAAVAGMVGDLVESLIKRSIAVKDSASLVPEFGGVLDIIDSILFVGPLVYVAALVSVALA